MIKQSEYQVVYVHWLDASYLEGEQEVEKIDWRCDLHYVGWLVREDEEAVILSLEMPHEGHTRNTFTIPKANIVEIKRAEVKKIFSKTRTKK